MTYIEPSDTSVFPIPGEDEYFDDFNRDETIWRYKSFTDFLWMLSQHKLHFHLLEDFNDEFEATIPKSLKDFRDYKKVNPEGFDNWDDWAKIADKESRLAKKILFVNCWHRNKNESAAMWEIYGGQKSIAIKSTIGKLIDVIDKMFRDIYLSPVLYINYYKYFNKLDEKDRCKFREFTTRSGNSSNYCFPPYAILKREEFSYENEIRAIIVDPTNIQSCSQSTDINDIENEEIDKLEIVETHKNLCVDLDNLIEEIIISPTLDDRIQKTMKDTLEKMSGKQASFDIEISKMDQQPWH